MDGLFAGGGGVLLFGVVSQRELNLGDQKRPPSRGDRERAASHRVSEAPVSPGRAVAVLVRPVWSEGPLPQALKISPQAGRVGPSLPFQSHFKHPGDSQRGPGQTPGSGP